MQCPITMAVLAVAAAIASAVVSAQAAKKQAQAARQSAKEKAQLERANATNAATRAAMAAAQEKAATTIEAAALRGKVRNLQNRSDSQIAGLLRQADREQGDASTAINMRLANTNADVRTAFNNIAFNQKAAFRANPNPSKSALGLAIAGAVIEGGSKVAAASAAGAKA